jgi:hypothetical protein
MYILVDYNDPTSIKQTRDATVAQSWLVQWGMVVVNIYDHSYQYIDAHGEHHTRNLDRAQEKPHD